MNSSIQKVIRIIPLAVIAMTLDFQVLAQLNPRSTLYAFHQSSYNPAICGASEYGNASAVIRKQYMGFVDNAGPATTWIDFSMPIKLRPRPAATTAVVPEPIKGSNTI